MKRKSSSSDTGSTSHGTSGAMFDVFLSFRGPDTHANFTDTLYHALLDKGIRVFIDKKGIDVGEEIGPEIFQAIDDSKICIPIFSTGYASSRWCLRELEHMMKRKKTNELEVMPIFYDVEPSDVKLETGVYRDALTQHEKERGTETVRGWAEALKEVTKIKGWDTKNTGHGELTRLIARKVLVMLKVSCVDIPDYIVGMDRSLKEVLDLFNVESKDIRLIGICGMGGIGKTTLAKVLYSKLSTKFESCSFISNIREASKGSGLSNLQRQLVSDILGDVGVEFTSIDHGTNMIKDRFNRKKVLIFLDDVDHRSQLTAFAARSEWFGLGSRIVVTTRDISVLSGFQDQFEHCLIYEAKELNNHESLQLFSKHAFRSNSPPKEFLSLSEKVTAKTGGLPLAIEVMGSILGVREKTAWQKTLEKMELCPLKDVKDKLMLSYEALDHHQRQIFLDIACFLAGEDKRVAHYMWDDCGFFPDDGIEVLLLMSLVKITETNQLWMHDQLKDLGKSIVYQENYRDPEKRSRLWNHKEGLDLIKRKKGTQAVEAMCTKFDALLPDAGLTSKEFIKVPNIRFLRMFGWTLHGDFEDLFSELRWLSWNYCPHYMQAINLCPKDLLILDLSFSLIDEHWGGWTQLKVAARLKVLNLSNCLLLRTTPDLSTYPSLEILILEGCGNLLSIDSIGHLTHLKLLNLNGCYQLQELPGGLDSLTALSELRVISRNISQVPSSIDALVNLQCLAICGAPNLIALPDSIGMLKSLVELDVSKTGITELPNSIVHLKSLKVLKMNRSQIRKLPDGMGMLEKLEEIYGEYCLRLETIPGDIARLPFLKILKLTQTRLKKVPKLPKSLVSVHLSSIAPETPPEIPKGRRSFHLARKGLPRGVVVTLVKAKRRLCKPWGPHPFACPEVGTYSPCCVLELPKITSISLCLGGLCYLKELELKNCNNLSGIGQLSSSLRKLTINNCNLRPVVMLSNLENLLELSFENQISNIGGLEGLTSLQCLRVNHCQSNEFRGLGRLKNLRLLWISGCPFLKTLPNLSDLENLKEFELWSCPELVEIQGLDTLESLESLTIGDCSSLRSFPDLTHLKMEKTSSVNSPKIFRWRITPESL